MPRQTQCRACTLGQRLSTLTFAVFAVLLALASSDPDETPLRQGLLMACAALTGIAVFRFGVARLLARVLQPRGQSHRSPR